MNHCQFCKISVSRFLFQYFYNSFLYFSDFPSITNHTSKFTITPGSKLRLDCIGSSLNTPITVMWIKNNKILARSSYTVSIKKHESQLLINSTLVIESVNISDSGVYVCKFVNQFNTITSDANLVTILGKSLGFYGYILLKSSSSTLLK